MVSHQRQKKTEVTMTLLTLARLRVRLRGRTATHYGEYGKGAPTGVALTEAYDLKGNMPSQYSEWK